MSLAKFNNIHHIQSSACSPFNIAQNRYVVSDQGCPSPAGLDWLKICKGSRRTQQLRKKMDFGWPESSTPNTASTDGSSVSFRHRDTVGLTETDKKSLVPCRFFAAGKCVLGENCTFSHVHPSEGETALCKFFLAGHCKFGTACALKHASPSWTPNTRTDLTSVSTGMSRLQFDTEDDSPPEESLPARNGASRSSLLPSFLLDELLLDGDDGKESRSKGVSPVLFPAAAVTTSSGFKPDTVLSPGRSCEDICVNLHESSPHAVPPALTTSSKAPMAGAISYGQAILTGTQPSASSVSPSYSVMSPASPVPNVSIPFDSQMSRPEELCAFSIMGKCRYGDYCRNVHGLQCPRCLLHVLHPTDMDRNEEHLYECLSKPESVPIAQLHQIKCGLCNDQVLQKVDPRFGLLNCSHPFCLSCIRSWRATHFDASNESSRSCPHCREVTYFIVPSSTWIDDSVEKLKTIEQYKKKMSLIPCKYHEYGRGDCPFGSSCFYQHKSDTSELRSAYRQVLDHTERIAKVRETKLSDYIVFKSVPAHNKKK